MELFIGNLAEKVTYADLIGFFKGFSNKAKIRIVIKRQANGSRIRYGVIVFDSDKFALKAIKKLNRKPLRGLCVELREYFHRYYANERRALNWRDKPWSGVERRQHERRKPQEGRADNAPPKSQKREADKAGGFSHQVRKG